jgi:hypothetical protein
VERIPQVSIPASAIAVLTVVALAAFLRRAAGGPPGDLPAGEVAVYASLYASAGAVAIRSVARQCRCASQGLTAPASFLLSCVFIAALSREPLSVLVGLFAGAFVCTCAALADTFEIRSLAQLSREAATGDPHDTAAPSRPTRPDVSPPTHAPPDMEIVRCAIKGGERLSGTIRFEIAPGEAMKILHVPLWPSLAGPPEVHCELDGIEGRVRAPVAMPHGLRIEVRLEEPVDEPLSGAVRFTAECRSGAAAA